MILLGFIIECWCKFGAKLYKTTQTFYNDIQFWRNKTAQYTRFTTILHDINGTPKTPRDNFGFAEHKNALHMQSIFYYLFENSYIRLSASYIAAQ